MDKPTKAELNIKIVMDNKKNLLVTPIFSNVGLTKQFICYLAYWDGTYHTENDGLLKAEYVDNMIHTPGYYLVKADYETEHIEWVVNLNEALAYQQATVYVP